MVDLESHPRGVILPVRARAGGRVNRVTGTHDGMLCVSVTAAPEKGKANKAIVAVLSDALGVAKSAIELVAGETSPRKRFLITGSDTAELQSKISHLCIV